MCEGGWVVGQVCVCVCLSVCDVKVFCSYLRTYVYGETQKYAQCSVAKVTLPTKC